LSKEQKKDEIGEEEIKLSESGVSRRLKLEISDLNGTYA